MSEPNPDLRVEIAHVLFIDVVGYSKLLMNEQSEVLRQFNQIVQSTNQFRLAEAAKKLIHIPVGDGMALVFFHNPEVPVRTAVEISEALQNHPQIRVRMGIHSGPVNEVLDVNDRSNVAGAGINVSSVAKLPGGPSYGELKFDLVWDGLRGDPRFEKIVAWFAPK